MKNAECRMEKLSSFCILQSSFGILRCVMAELREEIVTHPEELAACCAELAECRTFRLRYRVCRRGHLSSESVSGAGGDAGLPLSHRSADGGTARRLLASWWSIRRVWSSSTPAARKCACAGCGPASTPGNLFDLQLAAGLAGLAYPLGHGTLVHQVLGVQLAKGETLTEWRHRPLTSGQIRYAFDDVRYLLPVWQRLSARLEELGRARLGARGVRAPGGERGAGGAGHGEMAEAARPRLAGPPPSGHRPRPVQLARGDRRPHQSADPRASSATICIVEIARRNPTRERDLQVVRGLPRRDLDAIIQTVAEARGLALDACPVVHGREQDPPQVALVANVLTAVLGDVCARRSLAANLVASNNDVKLLVRARLAGQPLPAESLLTAGWRSAHILPELLAVLDGRRLLRIADVRAEAPLRLRGRKIR